MTKKILIVTATFYPLNTPRANRATELAKELSRLGHKVTVLTPKNDKQHQPFEEKYGITIRDMGQRRWKPVLLKRKGPAGLFERAVARFSNLLIEYPDLELKAMVKKALRKENSYHLLISIAVPYPVHWGVAAARTEHHQVANTWVADCGDPYMGDRTDSFRKLFYFKYVEKWFCRKADYLAVPTAGSVDAYYPEFHSKIKVIPQGFNIEESELYTGEINNHVPTFAYAGGFIAGIRDPGELLNYLVSFPRAYKFIIYTTNKELVEPYIQPSGNRIELRSYIPRQELLYELSKMDFLVNFTNGTAVQTPSKLIDYAIAKRPVLSVETRNLDTEAVNSFLSGDYTRQFNLGDIERYNIKNVAKQFLGLIDGS